MSVSDDAADEEVGGGSMQVWRINHLIYKDEDEVVNELEKHKYVCASCADHGVLSVVQLSVLIYTLK